MRTVDLGRPIEEAGLGEHFARLGVLPVGIHLGVAHPAGLERGRPSEIHRAAIGGRSATLAASAIASSSLATEWLKGRTVDDAAKIKNTDIVSELKLPPVKIHCSVLAEDAIKAALQDYKEKWSKAEAPAEQGAS